MKTLVDHLSQYAAYHRDRRNVATHYLGIPMIVAAIAILLSRPAIEAGGLALSPATAAVAAAVLFYLRLDARYGAAMALLLAAALWLGQAVAALPTVAWLSIGVGLFAVGWVLQFVGHAFEGRKPAFVDDLVGLIVGPLFVVAEWGFALGLRLEVRDAIEGRTGGVEARAGA